MVANRFSLLFRLKKQGNSIKRNMPVYMRITVDGERTELSVDREFDSQRWNKKFGRATGTTEDAKTLNAYLDSLQIKVHEAYRELLEANETITTENLKNKLQGKETRRYRMFLEVFKEHNKQMEKLIPNNEYAQGTLMHFETTYKHIQSFLVWKYELKDVPIEKVDIPVNRIDYSFISDFEYYLKAEVCAHNTSMKYLGDLKKIVLICVKRGWLPKDPFMGYKMSRKEVVKEFLVDHELKAIENKRFLTERLTLVRDIFLFSCYTGLAYADVKKLRFSEIRIGIDGKKWLFIQRKKSSTPAPVPLLPVALSILDKYKDHPRCVNADKVLPILCNQKMNEYLKEIADLCEINKTLTYHTARHTFGTTVTLNNNVPMESVSRM
ncbi:MAG TPA: site-specific integrase, partial [Chitinophagaceae bacterium]|nr:site-specific integrase [Chitinophagaceae bacterium]